MTGVCFSSLEKELVCLRRERKHGLSHAQQASSVVSDAGSEVQDVFAGKQAVQCVAQQGVKVVLRVRLCRVRHIGASFQSLQFIRC